MGVPEAYTRHVNNSNLKYCPAFPPRRTWVAWEDSRHLPERGLDGQAPPGVRSARHPAHGKRSLSVLVLLLVAAQAGAAASDTGPAAPRRATVPCRVTRIVDGDTIACAGVGRVRLIGMDSPESGQGPFAARADSALAALLPPGSDALLEGDVEPRDRYGRVLAYVWFNGVMINREMVRRGWAVLLTYPPNVQYVDALAAAQSRARAERRGLWAVHGFDCLPRDRRRRRC